MRWRIIELIFITKVVKLIKNIGVRLLRSIITIRFFRIFRVWTLWSLLELLKLILWLMITSSSTPTPRCLLCFHLITHPLRILANRISKRLIHMSCQIWTLLVIKVLLKLWRILSLILSSCNSTLTTPLSSSLSSSLTKSFLIFIWMFTATLKWLIVISMLLIVLLSNPGIFSLILMELFILVIVLVLVHSWLIILEGVLIWRCIILHVGVLCRLILFPIFTPLYRLIIWILLLKWELVSIRILMCKLIKVLLVEHIRWELSSLKRLICLILVDSKIRIHVIWELLLILIHKTSLRSSVLKAFMLISSQCLHRLMLSKIVFRTVFLQLFHALLRLKI